MLLPPFFILVCKGFSVLSQDLLWLTGQPATANKQHQISANENPVGWRSRCILTDQSVCRSDTGKGLMVHYIIHKPNGKFRTMERVEAATSGELTVCDRIDFEYPWSLGECDKTGCRNFLFALKAILFGNSGGAWPRQNVRRFSTMIGTYLKLTRYVCHCHVVGWTQCKIR